MISEYDYLYCNKEVEPNQKHHLIDASTFWYIKKYVEENHQLNEFITLWSKKLYKDIIQVKNYVWVLQTKDNVVIEILPKIHKAEWDEQASKRVFLKMLKKLKQSPFKHINEAHLQRKKFPIIEIFIELFLKEVDRILKAWIKKDYISHQNNLPYLKWKLLVWENIRRNVVSKEKFYVQYDVFTEDVPENRLIKTCLQYLQKCSRSIKNQKKIKEFLFVFDEVGISKNIKKDFSKCKTSNRLQHHYIEVMKRVSLFLDQKSIVNFHWDYMSLALLFPMEFLFENYVAHQLKVQYPKREHKTQDRAYSLVDNHRWKRIFQMKPDIVMRKEERTVVLDTKRKMINENNRDKKYDISQSDMYQLFAYSQKYDSDSVYLIYPRSQNFVNDLPPFQFQEWDKSLYVVGYDLVSDDIGIIENI